jgi:hypothetical protein
VLFVALAILLKLAPPSELSCHWMLGVGLPLADAVNETVPPAHTALLIGLAVTEGAVLTVMAALPDAVPVQFASETAVTVWVLFVMGFTNRVSGLLKTLLLVAPSDHTTVHGPVPVSPT